MDLLEALERKETLHPDLKRGLHKDGFLGPCIKTPLVFAVPYTEALNALYNESYTHKKNLLDEYRRDGKWGNYVFIHEKPYRIDALVGVRDHVRGGEYWELLANVWMNSENLWQYGRMLDALLARPEPGREKMMRPAERDVLAGLPDRFVIYRGCRKHNRLGHSWTLSYWEARWFANRFQEGTVVKAVVNKKDVIAYLTRRNEQEIIAMPNSLTQVSTVRKLRQPVLVECAYRLAKDKFALGTGSCHGPWHWDKVERNAIALAKETPKADVLVCRLFAMLHDHLRVDEDDDPDHGARAADYVSKSYSSKGLTAKQVETLAEACRHHTDGQTSDDPTIGVCWDADRLDLIRVGIIPDPARLSTAAAKRLLWQI